MNHLRAWRSLFLLIAVLGGCQPSQTISKPASNSQAQAIPSSKQPDNYIHLLQSPSNKSDALSYGGYDLVKLTKKVKLEETSGLTEVSYAVLKRNGKVLAKFDGVYSGWGNATGFGLFSFLSRDAKQLFVSQTIPRGGRHWVVNLSPVFHILYDSGNWGVGRDDFTVIDVDGDGVYEISQEMTAFYGFENMSPSETPLPEVIFRYDERERRYLPANHLFPNFALEGIERQIENTRVSERRLSSVLHVVLRYIYAGRDQEAWSFFEREYAQADEKQMKAKILAVLRDEAVYKYLHRRAQPNNSFNPTPR
jgi:hypothetical protein